MMVAWAWGQGLRCPMPATTVVLFDLDGTLIDSVDLIRQSFRHMLRTHRGIEPSEEAWLAGLGTPLRMQFRAYTSDPAEIEAMLATYQEHNLANHDRMVTAYPGAVEAVRSLKTRGIKLGIVTSKLTKNAKRGISVGGFDGLFDTIIGADETTVHKPDPTPVLHALKQLGAKADQAVFVGDSPHDITAGRRAGTRTAAALWGPFSRAVIEPAHPDQWLTKPSQMATLA